MRALVIAAALLVGCNADVDPPWQLDHDRIIAVRATPPRILPGERADLDLLIGRAGNSPVELAPHAATVISPTSLAGALAAEGDRWVVTAPTDAQLAAARAELELAPDAPVPLVVGVAVTQSAFPSGAGPFSAIKTVWLGASAQNPVLDSAMVAGAAPAEMTPLVVGTGVDVPLSVGFDETHTITWLTSCGTMHDFDLPSAYLRVEPEDPTVGDLAVVVRTAEGGVAWRVWPIRAE